MKMHKKITMCMSAIHFISIPFNALSHNALEIFQPKVFIVYNATGTPVQLALAEESAAAISKTFHRLGRFLPVEQNEIDNARKKNIAFEKNNENALRDFAAACNADIYVSLSFTQSGKTNIADIKIRALRDEWKFIEKSQRIQSKIPKNIPALLSKEIALIHKNIPIFAKVTETLEKGFVHISAGEWNGITVGNYTTDKGIIRVIQTGKYQSIVKSDYLNKNDELKLHVYPDISTITNELDTIIVQNTIKTYAIAEKQLKNDNDELRCISATCVINPGGSFCLGGYGAFLSTYYLGFQNPAPAIDGIVISSLVYASQLLLIPASSMFQSNFFPWVRDSNKTERQQQLHIFLWATIPLTFSASFFDQLAYQCHRSEVLPPYFLYHDNTAAFLSAIIPGGGHFFKGYRYIGWVYFLLEMALGSYCAYYWQDGSKKNFLLPTIAVTKMIEILHAYFVKPAYLFFSNEIATGKTEMIFAATITEERGTDVCYWLGVKRLF